MELAVYAVFVFAYFFLVLHFLGGWLKHIFDQNKTLYAFVALALKSLFAGRRTGNAHHRACCGGSFAGAKAESWISLISGTHINPVYLMHHRIHHRDLWRIFGVGGGSFPSQGPRLVLLRRANEFRRGHRPRAHRRKIHRRRQETSRAWQRRHQARYFRSAATATILGVETGAQIIQQLKRHKNVDFQSSPSPLSSSSSGFRPSSPGSAGKP